MSFDHSQRLSPDRKFLPLNLVILTVSDTRTPETDRSGDTLQQLAEGDGHRVIVRKILPDEQAQLVAALRGWIADPDIDAVIATGGTGLTGRDLTPEAFQEVLEKQIPGFGEIFRWLSYQKIGTATLHSRALAGLSAGTLLFALPGSTGGCRDAWEGILRWQLDARLRPCNLVELMPRFTER